MMISKKTFLFFSFFVLVIFTMQSCLKGEFETPPAIEEPVIAEDQIVTLESVLQKMVSGQVVKLDMDKYIKAIVIADDKSGNFYKTIHVKDENSPRAISIAIEEVEIHSHYPVGRRVFIHLKDLYIGENAGLPTLNYGFYIDAGRVNLTGIPGSLLQKTLLKGKAGNPVEPIKVKLTDLNPSLLNSLIQLDDVEFANGGFNVKYADNNPVNPRTVNQDLVDCKQNKIVVRTSGYADFANAVLPRKNGSIVGIYTVFNTTNQLFIRDTTDVKFDLPRCAEKGDPISIKTLRDNFANGITVIPAERYISGVVISDFENINIHPNNLVLQDGESGMAIRLSAPNTIPLGTEIRINVNGLSVSEFNGLVQINNVPLGNIVVIGPGTLPTPKVVKVNQINSLDHESTLVKVVDAEISGGATYGVNTVTLKDNTGSIQLFTRTQSTFSSQPIKTGKVSVTGIVGRFNSIQLSVRNLADIQ